MDGFRKIVINTQERAISSDVNRLEKFVAREVMEMFRRLADDVSNLDLDGGVVSSSFSSIASPLRAEIGSGFQVQVVAGATDLSVDPGWMAALAPDGAADESNYKLVRDPGIAVGTLSIAANPAGSARIDVVECSIDPTPDTVSDSRDIFNVSTGLFSASLVTKEMQSKLTYRVRQGTAGAGLPGVASGWLPLCIASAPSGSTSNDVVTFWDVRPVLRGRENGLSAMTRDVPKLNDAFYTLDAAHILRGSAEIIGPNGRIYGGRLRRGTPGADTDTLDLSTNANWSMGSLTANSFTYLYLLMPHGLPGWVRYTGGPSGRQPRGPIGIPTLSTTQPAHWKNKPSAAVTIPTSTGLTTSTAEGVCIGVFPINNSTVMDPLQCRGREQHLSKTSSTNTHLNGLAGANANGLSTWNLVEGTNFPANAKSLLLKVSMAIGCADGSYNVFQSVFAQLHADSTNTSVAGIAHLQNAWSFIETGVGAGSRGNEWVFWIDVPSESFPVDPDSNTTRLLRFQFSQDTSDGTATGTASGSTLTILGWRT